MKYRIKELTYKNGNKVFVVQEKGSLCWIDTTEYDRSYPPHEADRPVRFDTKEEAINFIKTEEGRKLDNIEFHYY